MSFDKLFSKKGSRNLSSFLAKELVYDYLYDLLDADRKAAVEKILETDREAKNEIKRLRDAEKYLETMGKIKISRGFLSEVQHATSYFEVLIEKTRFHQWPQGARWAAESAGVAFVVIAFAVIVPWNKLTSLKFSQSPEVVLAEVSKEYAQKSENKNEPPVLETQETQFKDEGSAAASSSTTSTVPVAAVAVAVKATTTTTVTSTTLPTVAANADKKTQGYLYRGSIQITNVAAVNPKLVEKIKALGGRKAGEVELGWNKGNGSYFHFTMPESHYDELLVLFNEYGKLSIQREKHERIMPEGIIRLIINVDEKK